ncbi:MAG: TonB-dependent receptor [Candidatus Adiutrix sp.]|nr:TonB-dependent receptor [Candidatus Adiutrix sp.]
MSLTLILTGSAWAADEEEETAGPENQAVAMKTINVTANRVERDLMELSQTVNVITAEEIERMPANTITDVLTRIPGIDVAPDINDVPNAGMSSISLRGETTGRTLILVNGVKQVDQNKGYSNIYISPSQIERIEVIKGPASVLYGAEAIGGVVNIITKKGGDKPVGFSLGSIYDSSTDGKNGTAALFGRLDNGFNYRFSGNMTNAGMRKVPSGSLDNQGNLVDKGYGTEYKNRSYAGQVGYDWDNYSFTLQADHFESQSFNSRPRESETASANNQGTQITTTESKSWAPVNDRDTILATFMADDLGEHFRKLTVTTSYQKIDREQNDYGWTQIANPGGQLLVNPYDFDRYLSSTQKQLTATVQGEWQVGKHYVTAGFESSFDDVLVSNRGEKAPPVGNPGAPSTYDPARDYGEGSADVDLKNYSVFLQDEWDFATDWKAVLGLRQTWQEGRVKSVRGNTYRDFGNPSRKFSDLVGSLGLVYNLTDNLALRAQWSQGVRYPTVAQMYTGSGSAGGGEPITPNPDLEPEESTSYEIGARYAGEALSLDLAVYHTRAKNFIERVQCPSSGIAGTTFCNLGWANSTGVELTASYLFESLGLTPYTSVTYLHRKQTLGRSTTGEVTSKTRNPPYSGKVGLRYEKDLNSIGNGDMLFYSDLYMNWSAETTDGASARGGNGFYAGWQCYNLNLGLQGGEEHRYTVNLSLNNILNEHYSPARSANRGTGGGNNLPAPARHVVLGVTYEF